MTTLEQSKPAGEARDSVLRSGSVSSCNDLLEDKKKRKKAYMKNWWASNQEIKHLYNRQYRQRHAQSVRNRQREWYRKNSEHVKAKSRAWVKKNANRKKVLRKEWRARNRKTINRYARQRYAHNRTAIRAYNRERMKRAVVESKPSYIRSLLFRRGGPAHVPESFIKLKIKLIKLKALCKKTKTPTPEISTTT